MDITPNITVLTALQTPARWSGRESIWVHPGTVLGELPTTYRRPSRSPLSEDVRTYLYTQHEVVIGEEVVGRDISYLTPSTTTVGGTPLEEVLAGPNALRARAVTHPEEFFSDAVPEGNRDWFVTVHEGQPYLCSHLPFDRHRVQSLQVGTAEWNGYAVEVTEEQALRMTRASTETASRLEVVDLRRQVEQQRQEMATFLRDVQDKAREAKARGWCGEVERMLQEAGVSSQYTSSGVLTLEVAFTDHSLTLAEATQPQHVARAVHRRLVEALKGHDVTTTLTGAVVDSETVVL